MKINTIFLSTIIFGFLLSFSFNQSFAPVLLGITAEEIGKAIITVVNNTEYTLNGELKRYLQDIEEVIFKPNSTQYFECYYSSRKDMRHTHGFFSFDPRIVACIIIENPNPIFIRQDEDVIALGNNYLNFVYISQLMQRCSDVYPETILTKFSFGVPLDEEVSKLNTTLLSSQGEIYYVTITFEGEHLELSRIDVDRCIFELRS
jgi:hypothetical protein